MIDGVHPTIAIKNTTNVTASTTPKSRDVFPKIRRTISTNIDKCVPLATTICVNPTSLSPSLSVSPSPAFIPKRYDSPSFASTSGISPLTRFANQFRTASAGALGSGFSNFTTVGRYIYPT